MGPRFWPYKVTNKVTNTKTQETLVHLVSFINYIYLTLNTIICLFGHNKYLCPVWDECRAQKHSFSIKHRNLTLTLHTHGKIILSAMQLFFFPTLKVILLQGEPCYFPIKIFPCGVI